jgi:hypothetical protein
MSSRENPSAVCVRSFVPKEKNSAWRAISPAAGAHVRHARLGGDREAARHELQAEHASHLGEVGALPPSRSRISREPSAKS